MFRFSVLLLLALGATAPAQNPVAGATPIPSLPPLGQATTTPSMKDFYIGKTWQSPAGTNYTFQPDGKCLKVFGNKQDVFKWRTIGSRVVEVSGRDPRETRYFRFVSPTEACYGDNKNQIKTPITAK